MNDYGFELFSDQPIPLDDTNAYEFFLPKILLKIFNAALTAQKWQKENFAI